MTEIDALWDFTDPVATEARFREEMAGVQGDARDEYATQVARALGLQGRFEEGHRLLDDLDAPPGSRAAVRGELERGRLLNSAGKPADAVPHFLAARDLAQSRDEIGLEIDAIHMLAIADPDQAEAWTEDALRRAGMSDDSAAKRWIGPLLNNLGWSRFDARRFDAALKSFQASEAAYASAGKTGEVAIARWSGARCLREMGDVQAALEIQLGLASTNSEPDPYVFEELVAIYERLGDQDAARRWQAALDEIGDTTD